MSTATEGAAFDVYLTDAKPGISVVKDDGHISATRWSTSREALAYLVGCGCDIAPLNDRQLIETAISAKYGNLEYS